MDNKYIVLNGMDGKVAINKEFINAIENENTSLYKGCRTRITYSGGDTMVKESIEEILNMIK